MKFIPLLFSTPMVQAEQAGRKTMTRRTKGLETINITPDNWDCVKEPNETEYFFFSKEQEDLMYRIKCPYGQVGDVLWVRETFYAYGRWVKNGLTKKGKQKYKFNDFTLTANSDFQYKYEDSKPHRIKKGRNNEIGWYKRPSLFMPKAACRTFLEITNIRVERLNDINEVDSISEGVLSLDKNWVFNNFPSYHQEYENWVSGKYFGKPPIGPSPKQKFTVLWQSINGPDSWDPNPWVWMISFKRITKPENFC